jgi:hypothetical protein
MLTRLPDADSRLFSYIDRCKETGWKWGEFDCCQFCNGFIKAMTDVDVFETCVRDGVYSPYDDKDGGHGKNGSIFEALHAGIMHLGGKELPELMARTGDVCVYLNRDGQHNAGMVEAGRVVFASKEYGVDYLALHDAKILKCWRLIK